MFDVSRIVGVFQDDDNPETRAVGITSEDGNSLLLQVDDPVIILQMAQRLAMFAEEIRANEERGIDAFIKEVQESGANTIGEFAEMRRRQPKLSIVEKESGQCDS